MKCIPYVVIGATLKSNKVERREREGDSIAHSALLTLSMTGAVTLLLCAETDQHRHDTAWQGRKCQWPLSCLSFYTSSPLSGADLWSVPNL